MSQVPVEGYSRQRYVSCLNRDIAMTSSHCDAEVGFGQSMGVVDSVAHHRYPAAFGFEFCNQIQFVSWEEFGVELLDSYLPGNMLHRESQVT